jgi:hypothetical protein
MSALCVADILNIHLPSRIQAQMLVYVLRHLSLADVDVTERDSPAARHARCCAPMTSVGGCAVGTPPHLKLDQVAHVA